jgi:transcriptional regulator with XRE-family HTH domain
MALFGTLARLIYRQLCGLVQRPSETGPVIAHIGRCWSGDKANPGAVYDPELFRREILPRLALLKLSEIAEAAGCSKAYASDIRRGKWTPHVSTWAALSKLAGVSILPTYSPAL